MPLCSAGRRVSLSPGSLCADDAGISRALANCSPRQELVIRRTIRSIAFLHCVGSRQLDGINEPQPTDLKPTARAFVAAHSAAGLAVRQRFPQVHVYDFHRDIRTYGRGEETTTSMPVSRGCYSFAGIGPKMIRSVMKQHGSSRLRTMKRPEYGVRIHICEMSMGSWA